MTADEYLAWERMQSIRHEFDHGEVLAMAGGTMRHNALCASVIASLRTQLRRCFVFTSDQRVGSEQRGRYVYPDISVVCGPVVSEPGTNDVLANPSLIIEVLSASTEKYDRGGKWQRYQQIESLVEYVLVSQSEPRIEHFRRGKQGWDRQAVGAGARLVLASEAVLEVDAIYAGILDLPGDPAGDPPGTPEP